MSKDLPVPIGSNLPAIAQGETSSSAIAAREKAAVEARFVMALHRPRDFDHARLKLISACKRPRFAEVARYSKPIGKTKVFGLSIRFAEEARVLWGNLDVTVLLVFDDDERRIYRVQGTDLETNATESVDVMIEKFVERKSVSKGTEVIGQRLNSNKEVVYKVRATEDDMMTKVNNIISKYRRNVILTLIPADIKEECEDQIISTQKNEDRKDPDAARKKILELFYKLGVAPDQIDLMLGKPLAQVTPAELTLLRSYYTALKDGEATWTEIHDSHVGLHGPKATEPKAATNGASSLKAKLGVTETTETTEEL